jgi:hypothetical protein
LGILRLCKLLPLLSVAATLWVEMEVEADEMCGGRRCLLWFERCCRAVVGGGGAGSGTGKGGTGGGDEGCRDDGERHVGGRTQWPLLLLG